MTPPRGPWEPGASAAWSAELECRGCTHDRAGVDVVRVALAVLHLQGDSGVIIWKHKRRNSAHFVSGMQELGRFVTCIVIRCFSAYCRVYETLSGALAYISTTERVYYPVVSQDFHLRIVPVSVLDLSADST